MDTLFLIAFGIVALFLIIWILSSIFSNKEEIPVSDYEVEITEDYFIPVKNSDRVILKGTEKNSKSERKEKISPKKKEQKKESKDLSTELKSEKPKKKSYRKYNKKKNSKKDKGDDLILS